MKKILLTRNKYSLIDDEDFGELSQYTWSITNGYAVCWRSNKFYRMGLPRLIFMHRLVMGVDGVNDGMVVDHIDGNKLNNQKNNLRICTSQQNSMNMKKHQKAASKYKGVQKSRSKKKWQVFIWHEGRNKHLGLFHDEVEAAKAYDEAAKKLYGQYAKLNFE